jgi:predicted transcriptional regulator
MPARKAGEKRENGVCKPMAIRKLDDSHAFRQLTQKASKKAPVSWVETLRESDEDIAAGRVVPIDDVLKELDEMIASMEPSPSSKP